MVTWNKIKKALIYRSFRISLLATTLLIFICSFSASLWYIYGENKKIAIEVARERTSDSLDAIIGYVNLIFKKIKDISNLERSLILNENSISLENENLLSYMMHGIEIVLEITSIYVTGTNGNELTLFNLIGNEHHNSEYAKIPSGYRYAFQFIDRSISPPKEIWVYKDENWVTKETKEFGAPSFDSRKAPWFIGAETTKAPFWTPIYMLNEEQQAGISFGDPVYDNSGKLIAVTGSQIALGYISYFLKSQIVSKHSNTVLVNENGMLIAASNYFDNPKVKENLATRLVKISDYDPVISSAYEHYAQKKDSFFQYDYDGISYTAFMTPYMSPKGMEWTIAIVMPTEDILGGVWKMQLHLYYILSIVSLLAIIWIAYFANKISHPISILANEVDKVRHLDIAEKTSIKSFIKEIVLMQNAVNSMKSALTSIARYIPKEVVRKLFEQGKEIQLGGERKELVMFFSDVQDFTTISESLTVEQLEHQLTMYFETISHEILQNEGTIDKYIGDGILAFWGAPSDVKNAPYIACYTALLCQAKLIKINKVWENEGKPLFLTRIGLHVGNVIVGNIGTKERMNYSIVGDAVNLASRLEGVNKIYHTKICVSEDLYEKVKDHFLLRPLDIITVKGKTQPTKVYELVGLFEAKEEAIRPTKEQISICKEHSQAFELFHQNNHVEACKIFAALNQRYPDDYLFSFYLERCLQK